MTEYYQIKDGEVIRGPIALPANDQNTSGLHHLTTDELIQKGWIPQEIIKPNAELRPEENRLVLKTQKIEDNKIVDTWGLESLPVADVKNKKSAALDTRSEDFFTAGFTDDILGEDFIYPLDETSTNRMSQYLAYSTFISKDNLHWTIIRKSDDLKIRKAHTLAQLQGVYDRAFVAVMNFLETNAERKQSLRDAKTYDIAKAIKTK